MPDEVDVERFFQRGLKLHHLRTLAMFAALGQVKLVAARLHVTQPAISKQLAELEEGLGAQILRRVGNHLEFTPIGESLLRHAREVLLLLDHARRDLDALSSGLSGTIRMGAVATVLPVVARELVLEVKKRTPNVGVALHEDTSNKLFPMLVDGTLDVVFSRTEPPAPVAVELAEEEVLKDPIVIVCGRDHALATRRHLTPSDLAGIPWVLPHVGAPSFAALDSWMKRHRLAFPTGCVQSISLAVNERLMQDYPFLGLLPQSMTRDAQRREHFVVLALPRATFLPVVRLFHRRADANPLVAVTLDVARALREVLRR